MKLNIYKNRFSQGFESSIELTKVFELISTKESDVPKDDRLGIVYASTSSKGRKHEDILTFTGIAFIDVDNCSQPKKVKELFKSISCTIATWYSTSGNVHALIKIPICVSKDEFKLRYKLLTDDLRELVNDWGEIDTITTNPTQLAFISHDADLFINSEPQTFKGIYKPRPPKKVTSNTMVSPSTESSARWCVDKATEWFNSITTNGYPQVLRSAMTLGGWSGHGYISETEALQTLKYLIESNAYLTSKDSSGSVQTYIKGAESSFYEGVTKPLEWD